TPTVNMTAEATITIIAFLMASSGVLLLFMLVGARRTRLDTRLSDLEEQQGNPAGAAHEATQRPTARTQFTQETLPRLGTALMPSDEEEQGLLKTRLIHAGFYGRQALGVFLGVKLILMIAPTFIGLALGLMGIVPTQIAVLAGGCLGILGMIGPS